MKLQYHNPLRSLPAGVIGGIVGALVATGGGAAVVTLHSASAHLPGAVAAMPHATARHAASHPSFTAHAPWSAPALSAPSQAAVVPTEAAQTAPPVAIPPTTTPLPRGTPLPSFPSASATRTPTPTATPVPACNCTLLDDAGSATGSTTQVGTTGTIHDVNGQEDITITDDCAKATASVHPEIRWFHGGTLTILPVTVADGKAHVEVVPTTDAQYFQLTALSCAWRIQVTG